MTDQNPSPNEPTNEAFTYISTPREPQFPAPPKQNHTLKIVGIVVAVIVILAIIGAIAGGGNSNNGGGNSNSNSGGGTTSNTQSYSSWKAGFSPVWSQVEADWNSTSTALGNGDQTAASNGFSSLGQDAAQIARYENSPDPTLNADIQTLSDDLQTVAADGETALSSNSSSDFNTFGNDCTTFKADEATVANQITTDNSSLA
jgi:hypothetical protein